VVGAPVGAAERNTQKRNSYMTPSERLPSYAIGGSDSPVVGTVVGAHDHFVVLTAVERT